MDKANSKRLNLVDGVVTTIDLVGSYSKFLIKNFSTSELLICINGKWDNEQAIKILAGCYQIVLLSEGNYSARYIKAKGNGEIEIDALPSDAKFINIYGALSASTSGGGSGEETTIVANPVADSTAWLEKLQVGETVYNTRDNIMEFGIVYPHSDGGMNPNDRIRFLINENCQASIIGALNNALEEMGASITINNISEIPDIWNSIKGNADTDMFLQIVNLFYTYSFETSISEAGSSYLPFVCTASNNNMDVVAGALITDALIDGSSAQVVHCDNRVIDQLSGNENLVENSIIFTTIEYPD